MKCRILKNLKQQDLKKSKQKKYSIYKISYKEYLLYTLEGIVILLIVSYLFYERISVIFLLSPILYFFAKGRKQQTIERRKKVLKIQFRDLCISVSSGLSAGNSLVNSVIYSYKEVVGIYGENSIIVKELILIIKGLKISVPIERLFENLAERSDIDEIRTFSEVLNTAQKGGGDLIKIMKTTADGIGEKVDVEREILSIINSRKYEQMIMNIVPLFIILYMKITSPQSMSIMYQTGYGTVIMTICLVLYCVAYLMGKRMMKIDV